MNLTEWTAIVTPIALAITAIVTFLGTHSQRKQAERVEKAVIAKAEEDKKSAAERLKFDEAVATRLEERDKEAKERAQEAKDRDDMRASILKEINDKSDEQLVKTKEVHDIANSSFSKLEAKNTTLEGFLKDQAVTPETLAAAIDAALDKRELRTLRSQSGPLPLPVKVDDKTTVKVEITEPEGGKKSDASS